MGSFRFAGLHQLLHQAASIHMLLPVDDRWFLPISQCPAHFSAVGFSQVLETNSKVVKLCHEVLTSVTSFDTFLGGRGRIKKKKQL